MRKINGQFRSYSWKLKIPLPDAAEVEEYIKSLATPERKIVLHKIEINAAKAECEITFGMKCRSFGKPGLPNRLKRNLFLKFKGISILEISKAGQSAAKTKYGRPKRK